MKTISWKRWLKWSLVLGSAAALLWLVFSIYAAGQTVWAVGVLALVSLGFFIYLSDIAFAYRYLFPGLAAMAIFVAFPLLYTAQIGFTNYSSSNLLSFERARAYLLEQTTADDAHALAYTLHRDGDEFRVVLAPRHDEEDERDAAKLSALRAGSFVSSPLALVGRRLPTKIMMLPLGADNFRDSVQINQPLPLPELLRHRTRLMQLTLELPDHLLLNYAGLREFAPLNPVWKSGADGSLTRVETGVVYRPNHDTGYFENSQAERLQPGFKVGVGFANYARMVTDPDFRGPFLKIFVWTVLFAGITVLLTTAVGVTLAVMLNWESLRFRTAYRTLLFLPYAVPAFISILVFKGLFNQNFGEINMILNALFGVKPAWFADPLLAQVMILIVNTWLGYPYIMVLCTGLIKAIPSDLYEASAIAGAKPLTNFFKITVPLIIKPLTPLLISVFAFNFNNFVLIALLTDGRPDFLNTKLPAGTTDILVSYTYRIAFKDSGQNFGLAAAISTVIFFMVALLSLVNLKLAKVNDHKD
ncbi:MAG TPA: maltose ABC transporter permease MalF [Oxalobacteraceae bacterium]|jgi:maltose/maltodextrin transport system permease protein|nr:maltose ABC transporter permease MalF [Oxalobacteraceae bacterium]